MTRVVKAEVSTAFVAQPPRCQVRKSQPRCPQLHTQRHDHYKTRRANQYPTVISSKPVAMVMGVPAARKCFIANQGLPWSSVAISEFTFGKLVIGRAQATEQLRPQSKTASSRIPSAPPSRTTSGMNTSAATVCDTNVVAPIKISTNSTTSMYGSLDRYSSAALVRMSRRPLPLTAKPSAPPPPMRNKRCQLYELKVCLDTMPVPNASDMKSMETAVVPPKKSAMGWHANVASVANALSSHKAFANVMFSLSKTTVGMLIVSPLAWRLSSSSDASKW
mmetsp:Transcript_116298/g.231858  ORF Transcript_116298/g.231858 Transcript_116298/m.231858 type:complete len:277 (-) Transcript_116298:36-866(-)